jgi:hypothetical protein
MRAGGPGEELAAEADAHERLAAVQRLPYEVVLVHEPGMLVLLVHMHRAAEDDESVEALGCLGRRPLRDVPLEKLVVALADDIREEPGRAVVLVGQAEDAHGASLGKTAGPRAVLFEQGPVDYVTRGTQQVASSGGTDWGNAGIGASAALGVVLIAAAGAFVGRKKLVSA